MVVCMPDTFAGVRRAFHRAMARPEPFTPEQDVRMLFWNAVRSDAPMRALEVGTRQAVPGVATKHQALFGAPGPREYICLDIEAGPDVDVVGDLHALPADWSGRFDAFVAVAVFEHLERPWVAAKEVARILAPGGRFFVSTHQCFPIHGYPSDFFRFSKEALRLILEDAGLVVEACDYEHRCLIVPPHKVVPSRKMRIWNKLEPSFLLVTAMGRKG
jgi:SAM-dependent methyltransferase